MGSLTSLLVERQVASIRQVEEALSRQALYGGDLPTNLLELLGPPIEAALLSCLAELYALPATRAGVLPPSPERVLRLLPIDAALRHGMYPLAQTDTGLRLAVAGPLPQHVHEELAQTLGASVDAHITTIPRIRQALARDYGVPLDRRLTRLLARLEGLPDPYASAPPPPMAGPRMPPYIGGINDEPKTIPGLGFKPPPSIEQRPLPPPARPAPQRRARRRRGPMTAARAEEALRQMTSPEEALQIFFDFAQQFFLYSASFVVHGDLAEGRESFGPGSPTERLATLAFPLDLPSSLAIARGRGAPFCGPLGRTGLDARIAADLARPALAAVAIVPVMVRRRCVALLYGDEGDSPVELSHIGEVVSLASLVGNALEHALLRRKRDKGGPSPRPQSLAMAVQRNAQVTPARSREERASALVRALGVGPVAATAAPPINPDPPAPQPEPAPEEPREARSVRRASGTQPSVSPFELALAEAAKAESERRMLSSASSPAPPAAAEPSSSPPPTAIAGPSPEPPRESETPELSVGEADEDEILRSALDDLDSDAPPPPEPEPVSLPPGRGRSTSLPGPRPSLASCSRCPRSSSKSHPITAPSSMSCSPITTTPPKTISSARSSDKTSASCPPCSPGCPASSRSSAARSSRATSSPPTPAC